MSAEEHSQNSLQDLITFIIVCSTGALRFSKPIPPRSWTNLRDASAFGNKCMQKRMSEFTLEVGNKLPDISEDCLYLNIYKPKSNITSLPVMVWIHGGGFYLGAGSGYDGTELAANGVILVTINYRLDIFGFVSNNDDTIPGNYGMLDQVMALKWVKENIKSFGGNPNLVTIFGESAGSSSVSLLILSPLAKGLFHRAIMESGVSLSPFSVSQSNVRIKCSQALRLVGVMVGCDQDGSSEKLQCLRGVDSETLFNASRAIATSVGSIILWPPVVETVHGFMPDQPIHLLVQNKYNHVDTIRGFNRAELGYNVLEISNFSITQQEFADFIKDSTKKYAIAEPNKFMQTILNDFVGNDRSNGHYLLLKLIDVLSYIFFNGPTFIEANIDSSLAPEKTHYIYQFDHKPKLSFANSPDWMPPVHGEELGFVFGINLEEFKQEGKTPSAEDIMVSRIVQSLWTNFAKFGDPTKQGPGSTVIWNVYSQTHANVLHIDAQSRERVDDHTDSVKIASKFQELISLYSFPKQYQG